MERERFISINGRFLSSHVLKETDFEMQRITLLPSNTITKDVKRPKQEMLSKVHTTMENFPTQTVLSKRYTKTGV